MVVSVSWQSDGYAAIESTTAKSLAGLE